jgi:hypothetical protein
MSFGSIISGFGKAKDLVTGKDDEKDDDKKEEKQEKATSNESDQSSDDGEGQSTAGKFLGVVWNATKDTVSGIFDWNGSDDNNTELTNLQLTDGDKVLGPDGKPVDNTQPAKVEKKADGSEIVTSHSGEQVTVKPTDTPGVDDPWAYDTWWARYEEQEKANATAGTTTTDKPAEPTAEPTVAEKVANWVGDKWNRWFGDGKAGTFETTDSNGDRHSTTMSEKGVDHVSDKGKAHVDGRGLMEQSEHQRTEVDRATGRQSAFYENGGKMVKNPDGSIDMIGPNGEKVHINADVTAHHELNGRDLRINKHRVEQIVNGYRVVQNRGNEDPQAQMEEATRRTEDGEKKITTVAEQDGSQTIVINDGQGNIVQIKKDGTRVMTSENAPGVEIVAREGEEGVRMRIHGHEFDVRHQRGTDGKDRWYLYRHGQEGGHPEGWVEDDGSIYSYDKEDPTKVGERIGQVQGVSDGKLQMGGGEVDGRGQVNTAGVVADTQILENGVRVEGEDGTVTVSVNVQGDGKTSHVTRTSPDGKTDVSSVDGDDGELSVKTGVKTDEQGFVQTDENGLVAEDNGIVHRQDKINPATGEMETRLNQGDLNDDGKPDFAIVTYGPDGQPIVVDGLGNKFNLDGSFENGITGTKWNADGTVVFSDGTSVDADGNVYHNGTKVGSAGGFDSASSDGATAARVSNILALAASIGSSTSIDPGKLGQLRALYAELGVAQGAAAANGDLAAFVHADLAKAVIAGAITKQEGAEAMATLAKGLGIDVTNDQSTRLQAGARLHEVTTTQQEQAERRQGAAV